MNLFLLVAVPLATVAVQRWIDPSRKVFQEPKAWILGFVWAMVALVLSTPFTPFAVFSGNSVTTFLGQVIVDALFVPGLVVGAWVLTRKGQDSWELGLWLALVFTLAGMRDFAASSRAFDLTEYFLVPLNRIFLVLALPLVWRPLLSRNKIWDKVFWRGVFGLLILTPPIVQALSYVGWGWIDWVLLIAGIGLVALMQKKAGPSGNRPQQAGVEPISEDQQAQP